MDSHSGSGRRKNTDIDHPIAVAELLEAHGFAPEVVAAGLLHDVVEDTDTAIGEITDRFGPRVGELVAAMTEDDSIEPYEARKSEHRGRVASNVDASAIYAADKLAKTRALMDGAEPASDAQLEHYKRTLEMLSETQPDLAFLAELEGNLRAIDADRQHAARR